MTDAFGRRLIDEVVARVWLRVAARDLAGLAPLAEVVKTMSDLAEVTLAAAHRHHRAQLEREHGAPGGGGDLLIVGMGKLGGCELNVSSDIDLVFAYPDEGETAGPRALSNQRELPLQISTVPSDSLIGPRWMRSKSTSSCSVAFNGAVS